MNESSSGHESRRRAPLLKTALIRERRLAQGWSRLELGRRLGLQSTAVAALEDGRGHDRLMLPFLLRLSAVLGVELAALTVTVVEPHAPTSDDVIIEACLAEMSGGLVQREDLASALGWTLSRVHAALASLEARLANTGQRVHFVAGVMLRPAEQSLSPEVVERLRSRTRARRQLFLNHAELLRAVAVGTIDSTWEQRASTPDRMGMGALLRAGLVRKRGGRYELTPGCAYSLDLVSAGGGRRRGSSTGQG